MDYFQLDAKGDSFELPGLWFNASELHALLASHQLLSKVQPRCIHKNPNQEKPKLTPDREPMQKYVPVGRKMARQGSPISHRVW